MIVNINSKAKPISTIHFSVVHISSSILTCSLDMLLVYMIFGARPLEMGVEMRQSLLCNLFYIEDSVLEVKQK